MFKCYWGVAMIILITDAIFLKASFKIFVFKLSFYGKN